MRERGWRNLSTRSDTLQGKTKEQGGVEQNLTTSRYSDSEYEYRHVQLPKAMLKAIPRDYFDESKGTLKLLWEDEWRALGITQVSYPDFTRRIFGLDCAESRMGTL